MAKLMTAAALVLLAAPAADEELDKAAARAAEMGNYSCTITTKFEGGGGGGGAGGGDRNPPTELQVKPDAPMRLKRGDIEAFRRGDVLVARDGDAWKRVERPERGQGGEGGERRRGAQAVQMLRGVRAPHEVLKDLKSSAFKEVKREDGEGGRVFSGELTEDALKALRPGGGRRGGGGGGQDRPAPKATGTAKIWVNGDGAVTKYEVKIETTFTNRNDEEVTTKFTSTVEIKDVGSTTYDVPEEAAKQFEAKSAEK